MIANNYAKTDHYSPEQATTLPYISHTDLVRTSYINIQTLRFTHDCVNKQIN